MCKVNRTELRPNGLNSGDTNGHSMDVIDHSSVARSQGFILTRGFVPPTCFRCFTGDTHWFISVANKKPKDY